MEVIMKKITILTSVFLSMAFASSLTLNAMKQTEVGEIEKYKIVCLGENEKVEYLLEAPKDTLEQSKVFQNMLLDSHIVDKTIWVKLPRESMAAILPLMRKCAQYKTEELTKYDVILALAKEIAGNEIIKTQDLQLIFQAATYLDCQIIRAALGLSLQARHDLASLFPTVIRNLDLSCEGSHFLNEGVVVNYCINNRFLSNDEINIRPSDLAFCGMLSDEIVKNWHRLDAYVFEQIESECQTKVNDLADLFICLNLYFSNYSQRCECALGSLNTYFINHPQILVNAVHKILKSKTFEEASKLFELIPKENVNNSGFLIAVFLTYMVFNYEKKSFMLNGIPCNIDFSESYVTLMHDGIPCYIDFSESYVSLYEHSDIDLDKQPVLKYVSILLPIFKQNIQSLSITNGSFNGLALIFNDSNKFSWLKTLNLFQNQLVTLPLEICRLRKLQRLSLTRNNLTHIPVEISELKELQELSLNSNPNLSALPSTLVVLDNLKTLNIRNTNIRIRVLPRLLLKRWKEGELKIIGKNEQQLQQQFDKCFGLMLVSNQQ